ncbi:MAG: YdcF family protein [Pseudomonadota bacterium]
MLSLLALIMLLVGWRRMGLATLGLAFSWLYLCSTAGFANYLMGVLERDYPSSSMRVVEPADVIVLLGGAMRGHTHMGTLPDLNQHADRLVHAVHLFKSGKAPLILLSGGALPGNRPEASQMQDILNVMGVPSDRVLQEPRSRNTYENALYGAQLLDKFGFERILLVTSAYHMRRAMAVFTAQGVDVVPAPTDYQRVVGHALIPAWLPGLSNLSRSSYALHELFGYQYYRWRGWL